VTRYPKASAILPPRLLQLLPTGAVAGWRLHPLENAALSRRTPIAVTRRIAELTAAFLCAHLGIEGELRHADYIGHWLIRLKRYGGG
jgi:antirestriction protein ArdC